MLRCCDGTVLAFRPVGTFGDPLADEVDFILRNAVAGGGHGFLVFRWKRQHQIEHAFLRTLWHDHRPRFALAEGERPCLQIELAQQRLGIVTLDAAVSKDRFDLLHEIHRSISGGMECAEGERGEDDGEGGKVFHEECSARIDASLCRTCVPLGGCCRC